MKKLSFSKFYVFAQSFYFFCSGCEDTANESRIERREIGLKSDNKGSIVLSGSDSSRLLNFDESSSAASRLHALMTKASKPGDWTNYSEYLTEEANRQGLDNTMKLGASLILDAGDENAQYSALSVILKCFPDAESHLELYKNLPAGKLKSTAAASSASQFHQNNDIESLEFFYSNLDLGKDRISTAGKAAYLSLTNRGVDQTIEMIQKFDMPEEKRAAIFQILTTDAFKAIEESQESLVKFKSLVESMSDLDQQEVFHFLNRSANSPDK